MLGVRERPVSGTQSARRPPIAARAAIVHDWFQGFHGAERVVDAMRTGLFAGDTAPDVYTFHAARTLFLQSSRPPSWVSRGSPRCPEFASAVTIRAAGATSFL